MVFVCFAVLSAWLFGIGCRVSLGVSAGGINSVRVLWCLVPLGAEPVLAQRKIELFNQPFAVKQQMIRADAS